MQTGTRHTPAPRDDTECSDEYSGLTAPTPVVPSSWFASLLACVRRAATKSSASVGGCHSGFVNVKWTSESSVFPSSAWKHMFYAAVLQCQSYPTQSSGRRSTNTKTSYYFSRILQLCAGKFIYVHTSVGTFLLFSSKSQWYCEYCFILWTTLQPRPYSCLNKDAENAGTTGVDLKVYIPYSCTHLSYKRLDSQGNEVQFPARKKELGNTVQSGRSWPMFQRSILPASSCSKSKPSKKWASKQQYYYWTLKMEAVSVAVRTSASSYGSEPFKFYVWNPSQHTCCV
jgi:hypothetical protein